jgi:hypothetical protein
VTLPQLADAMAASFQSLDLAARHHVRKKMYEKLTSLPYREKTRGSTIPRHRGMSSDGQFSFNIFYRLNIDEFLP